MVAYIYTGICPDLPGSAQEPDQKNTIRKGRKEGRKAKEGKGIYIFVVQFNK